MVRYTSSQENVGQQQLANFQNQTNQPNIVEIRPGRTFDTSGGSSNAVTSRLPSRGRALVRSPSRGRLSNGVLPSRMRNESRHELCESLGILPSRLAQYGLPQDNRGMQSAGEYIIQPGERSRSRPFRSLRRQSSDSDLRNLARHIPNGISIRGKELANVEYRSRSRPRTSLARSDPTSNSITYRMIEPKKAGALIVNHTPWREVHEDHHARGGTLRQGSIYTPHRKATDPEMHRILEYYAPSETEEFQHYFDKLGRRKRERYKTFPESRISRPPRLGIQIYDKFGSVSTSTRGREQGPPERKKDDRSFLSLFGSKARHASDNKCTEHGNNNQMYREFGFANLERPERLRTLRGADIRTTTIDAGSLIAVRSCDDQPKYHKIGCNKRNLYLGTKDVSTNRKSGRDADIYYKEISDREYDEHASRARERREYPSQRFMFDYDSDSYVTRSSGSGRGKSRTRSRRRS